MSAPAATLTIVRRPSPTVFVALLLACAACKRATHPTAPVAPTTRTSTPTASPPAPASPASPAPTSTPAASPPPPPALASTPSPPPASPTPASRAPAKPPPPLKADAAKIQFDFVREAYDRWRAERAAELAPAKLSHRIDQASACSNCESLIVTERIVEPDGACRQGPWVMHVSRDDDPPASTTATQIASDCCEKNCPDRSPAGWLLQFDRMLVARDKQGLRRLVSPQHGLHVTTSFSSETGSAERAIFIEHGRPVGRSFDMLQPVQPLFDDIQCPATFDHAGDATCVAIGGGFRGAYVWHREGERVFLLSVDQQTH